MFIAANVPDIVFGSLVGVFVDRWNRKHILVLANLLLTLILLPLVTVRSTSMLWIVYVVSFMEAFMGLFVRVAENAFLPSLVAEKDLVAANSLNAFSMNAARLIGPALGGFVAILLSLTTVVLIDAASYLIAGIMAIFILGYVAQKSNDQISSTLLLSKWIGVWKEWLEGVSIVRRQRLLFILFIIVTVVSFGEGVFGALFIPFVNKLLHGGSLQLGWLMTAQGIGGVVGGVMLGWLGSKISISSSQRLLGISACLFGLIDLAIFNYPLFLSGIMPVIVLFVIVGLPDAGFSSSLYTLLQAESQEQFRGRIFGTVNTIRGLLGLIGMVFGSIAGDQLGIIPILNIQGFGYCIAGCIALLLLKSQLSNVSEPQKTVQHSEP